MKIDFSVNGNSAYPPPPLLVIAFFRIAYAYLNQKISVYNDNWCLSLSGQMHELGHNLNLHHSGEGDEEYGDKSGMMVRVEGRLCDVKCYCVLPT